MLAKLRQNGHLDGFETALKTKGDRLLQVRVSANLIQFDNQECLLSQIMGMNYQDYTTPDNAKIAFEAFFKVYQEIVPVTIAEYSQLNAFSRPRRWQFLGRHMATRRTFRSGDQRVNEQ